MPVHRALWHLWPCRGFPFTRAEEKTFVASLRALAAADVHAGQVRIYGSKVIQRDWATILMGMLRGGVSFQEARTLVPGLSAAPLLAVYVALDRDRAASVQAWQDLAASPSSQACEALGPLAGLLLPRPVQIVTVKAALLTADALTSAVADTCRQIAGQSELVLDMELRMAGARTDDLRRAAGRQLCDPHRQDLWGDTNYLTARVGALTPVRLAALFADRDAL